MHKKNGWPYEVPGFGSQECLISGCVTKGYRRDNFYMDLSLIPRLYDTSLSLNSIFFQFSAPAPSLSMAYYKYANVFSSPPHNSPPNPTTSGTCIIAESPKHPPLHPSHYPPCLEYILQVGRHRSCER